MKVLDNKVEISGHLRKLNATIGFVPTMGALHQGHLSLIKRAKSECDVVAVSIFVNPTQFNDPNDLRNYPRTLDADLKLLESIGGVDYVYAPTVEDIYPEPDTRQFDFGNLDKVMEGACRAGHFNGVAQVVSRLFDIVDCQKAYFGEKDFQQLAIIKELVRQFNYEIEIVGCPILRESDGLAMSSRNVLLSPEQRAAAPTIYKTLSEAAAGERNMSVEKFKCRIIENIDSNNYLKTEYVSVVNAQTLIELQSWGEACEKRCLVAVRVGNIRLIDNISL